MWQTRNSIVVIQAFREHDPAEVRKARAAFARFLQQLRDGSHPCRQPRTKATDMRFVGGDGAQFVLDLADDWWVVYQVSPSCEEDNGEVRFLHAGNLA